MGKRWAGSEVGGIKAEVGAEKVEVEIEVEV